MNYKSVIDRIADNLHIEKENGQIIKKIKHDIEDTIISAFGLSEQPRKEVYLKVDKTSDIVQSFDGGLLIDNFSMSVFECNGDVASYDVAVADDTLIGIMEYSGLHRVNTFSVDASITAFSGSVVSLLAEVIDSTGAILFSETVALTTVNTTYKFEPHLAGADLKARITITNTAPTVPMTITADNFTVNINNNEIELPDDFFIPYEVRYDRDGLRYYTKELSRSEYVSWTPNKIYNDDSSRSVTDPESFHNIMNYTEENIQYDGALGYLFQVKEGKTYFVFKPNIEGEIIISYSYIPNIRVQDADTLQINRRFLDLVVTGATLRELTRRLIKPDITDIELDGLRSSIGIYKEQYLIISNFFTSFANKRSEPATILPYVLGQDLDMELY